MDILPSVESEITIIIIMTLFYTDHARRKQPCVSCYGQLYKGENIIRLAEVGERYCRAFHPKCAQRELMSEIQRSKSVEWDPNFKRVLDQYRAERKMRIKPTPDQMRSMKR